MFHPSLRPRSRNHRVAPLHSFRGVPLYRHQPYTPLLRTRHQAVFPLSGGYHRVHERSRYRLPRRVLWKVVSPPVIPVILPCPRTKSFLPTPSYKRLGAEVVAALLMHRHFLVHRHLLVHRHQSYKALCPCTLPPPSPFLLLLPLLLVTTGLDHLRPSVLLWRPVALPRGRERWTQRRRKGVRRSLQVPLAGAEQEQPAQQAPQSPALAGRRRSPLELPLVLALPTTPHLAAKR